MCRKVHFSCSKASMAVNRRGREFRPDSRTPEVASQATLPEVHITRCSVSSGRRPSFSNRHRRIVKWVHTRCFIRWAIAAQEYDIFVSGREFVYKLVDLPWISLRVPSLKRLRLFQHFAADGLRSITQVYLFRGNCRSLLGRDMSLCDPTRRKAGRQHRDFSTILLLLLRS